MACVSVEHCDREAAAMFADGILPMDEMISHTFSFSELQKGFDLLQHPSKDYVKGVVLLAAVVFEILNNKDTSKA